MAITPGIFSTDVTTRTAAFAQKQANNTAIEDSQRKLNAALATLNAGGTVPISKTSRIIKAGGKLLIYNPEVIKNTSELKSANAEQERKLVAAAIASGKASPISESDLAGLVNPKANSTVTTPQKPAAPKTTLTGSANDDKGKKEPDVTVRTTADPNLSPGKRLKNPLAALSSYNYQLSLYMVTPDALEIFRQSGYQNISKLGVMSAASSPSSGSGSISPGAYIIAQSGGVHAEEARAPSFVFDYGIDNLTFTIAGPKDSGAPAAEYEFNFTITEPYGFSFISNLKRAASAIADYSQSLLNKKSAIVNKTEENPRGGAQSGDSANPNRAAAKTDAPDPKDSSESSANPVGQGSQGGIPVDPSKQLFVLGIRFYGYNASGKPVRGTDTTTVTNAWGGVIDGSKQEIDPGNSSFALFERYYPIMITSVKTTLDGKETKYAITAASNGMLAIGSKRGQVNTKTPLVASTVGEAFDQLTKKINEEQKTNNTQSGYTYKIKYASKADKNRIRSARIVSEADLDKYKWPGSGAQTTQESNTNTEVTAGQKPRDDARTIHIAEGTPIIQAINQIIAQSSFLEDALKIVYTTALEPGSEKPGAPALDNQGKKTIEWFHCTPDISNLVWDENRADWVYDINYILNVYDTPVLDTAYTNPGKQYYGPVKRYEYWYTGTNTEILNYKQELNTAYYTTVIDPNFSLLGPDKAADGNGGTNTKTAGNGSGNGAGITTSINDNQRTGQPIQGRPGVGMEAQNSYLTALFDPAAQAKAEVDILGDPDWLMATTQAVYNELGEPVALLGENESLVYNKFYGNDGYSISPAGGQVFFEIDFKEAIDYKSDGQNIPSLAGGGVTGAPGTMSINSSIMFWKDPKSLSSLVRGLSYAVTTVKNTFSGGKFTQKLIGVMNTFGDSGSIDDGSGREPTSTSSPTVPPPTLGAPDPNPKATEKRLKDFDKIIKGNPKDKKQVWDDIARGDPSYDIFKKSPTTNPVGNRPET